ncbi:hypothetical protein FB451DRAFT_1172455 [Mycena latifolia]|nr:hypothetical protein FB451DRAFT_1172455 [Mycena latifolia]
MTPTCIYLPKPPELVAADEPSDYTAYSAPPKVQYINLVGFSSVQFVQIKHEEHTIGPSPVETESLECTAHRVPSNSMIKKELSVWYGSTSTTIWLLFVLICLRWWSIPGAREMGSSIAPKSRNQLSVLLQLNGPPRVWRAALMKRAIRVTACGSGVRGVELELGALPGNLPALNKNDRESGQSQHRQKEEQAEDTKGTEDAVGVGGEGRWFPPHVLVRTIRVKIGGMETAGLNMMKVCNLESSAVEARSPEPRRTTATRTGLLTRDCTRGLYGVQGLLPSPGRMHPLMTAHSHSILPRSPFTPSVLPLIEFSPAYEHMRTRTCVSDVLVWEQWFEVRLTEGEEKEAGRPRAAAHGRAREAAGRRDSVDGAAELRTSGLWTEAWRTERFSGGRGRRGEARGMATHRGHIRDVRAAGASEFYKEGVKAEERVSEATAFPRSCDGTLRLGDPPRIFLRFGRKRAKSALSSAFGVSKRLTLVFLSRGGLVLSDLQIKEEEEEEAEATRQYVEHSHYQEGGVKPRQPMISPAWLGREQAGYSVTTSWVAHPNLSGIHWTTFNSTVPLGTNARIDCRIYYGHWFTIIHLEDVVSQFPEKPDDLILHQEVPEEKSRIGVNSTEFRVGSEQFVEEDLSEFNEWHMFADEECMNGIL